MTSLGRPPYWGRVASGVAATSSGGSRSGIGRLGGRRRGVGGQRADRWMVDALQEARRKRTHVVLAEQPEAMRRAGRPGRRPGREGWGVDPESRLPARWWDVRPQGTGARRESYALRPGADLVIGHEYA